MDIDKRYSRLNAYFVEVCGKFLWEQLHTINSVPEDGRGMLRYLRETLPRIYGKTYSEVIMVLSNLSLDEKRCLLPTNEEIDVQQLDVAIYIKINRLLEKEHWRFWQFLGYVRNYVSHIAMRNLLGYPNAQDFNWLKQSLIYYGFDRNDLNKCENDLFAE